MTASPSDTVTGSVQTDSPLIEPTLLRDALALINAFAFGMGEDGHLDFADRTGLATYLIERADALDMSREGWHARMDNADVRRRDQAIASLSFTGARYQLDYSLHNGMGELCYVRELAEATACADGRATLISAVILDRTEDVKSEAATVWRARHDTLTRLPNRSALTEGGTQLAELGDRIGIPVYLLRLRLANLDTLAETFGVDLKEHLLREAAQRMQSALRSPDLVARLDGADFAAVTLNSDPDTLSLRLRAAVTAEPYETAFGPLALELESSRAPLTTVDKALEETRLKLSGEVARLKPNSTDLPTVEAALSQNRLVLAFQPIVHAESHALHHYECLLRIKGDEGRLSSAFPFIVAAEEAGEVHRIDQFVLTATQPWLDDNPDLHLALNVSAGTIGDDDHSRAYIDQLGKIGDHTSRLTLEMTETLAIDDTAKASRFSAEVRALGCRFAVDDFASGHTSFRNLLAVEADCIKIDGSLVRGVALDQNKQAFIRMMVDLARTFSVETVAEMVEDRADAQLLARLGVDYLQGYYFGKPSLEPIWDAVE